MKLLIAERKPPPACRPPRGGRGLKHMPRYLYSIAYRRPPRGGRGLKQFLR